MLAIFLKAFYWIVIKQYFFTKEGAAANSANDFMLCLRFIG